jgi:hypothetical protein
MSTDDDVADVLTTHNLGMSATAQVPSTPPNSPQTSVAGSPRLATDVDRPLALADSERR